jgi:hypothetical protein
MLSQKLSPMILATCLLTACGGGGGGGSATSATPPVTSPPPSLPQVLRDLPATSLQTSRSLTSPDSYAVLSSSTTTVSASKRNDSAEASLTTGDQTLRISIDLRAGNAVLEDTKERLRTVWQTMPGGLMVRTYDAGGVYEVGFWIVGSKAYRMLSDNNTDTTNLVFVRDLSKPPPARLSSVPGVDTGRAQILSADVSCYGYMNSITEGPADYASTVSDAYEDVDNAAAKRVGMAAGVISRLWKRAASLCPDAPSPATDPAFGRAAVLDTLQRLGGQTLSQALAAYNNLKGFLDASAASVSAIQAGYVSVCCDADRTTGASVVSESPAIVSGFDPSPSLAVQNSLSKLPKKTQDANSCTSYVQTVRNIPSLTTPGALDGQEFILVRNGCTVLVQVGYCLGSFYNIGAPRPAACKLNQFRTLTPGESFEIITQERWLFVNTYRPRATSYFACPNWVGSAPVTVNGYTSGNPNAWCSYVSP